MPVVSDAATRAEAETASGPDVWLVYVRHGPCEDLRTNWWSQPVYTVQLPSDLDRFRLKDEDNEFSVMFELKGRWYPLIGVRQEPTGGVSCLYKKVNCWNTLRALRTAR